MIEAPSSPRVLATTIAAMLSLLAAGCTAGATTGSDDSETPLVQAPWLAGARATEQPATQNTTFPDTLSTDVAFDAPLPASFPEHPTECDQVHALRIRHVRGPANPVQADRVLVAQPGVLEGASAFHNVGAAFVTRAFEEHGAYVEFWAVDRRPNCLEDHDGLRLAAETLEGRDFIDYYYRDEPYRGHRFAGFLDPLTDAAWLADMGMAQTVADWHTIMTRIVPDQSARQARLYCGGHSLGGFISGAYANWDFDGDPATTADAGYNQCAGFFALDSVIQAGSMGMSGSAVAWLISLLDIPENVAQLMREGRFMRFVAIPGVIDPEVMNLLTGLGLAAALLPTEEANLIDYLPASDSVRDSMRLFHSRNLLSTLTRDPTIYDYRYTNQAMLAVFTDDNAMPFFFVNSSMGFFEGGRVADKTFPFGSGGTLAIATDDGGWFHRAPLYGWTNYDAIDDGAVALNDAGVPFTSSASEVTDVDDFARSMSGLPLNFVEEYFATRLAVDAVLGYDGNVHENGIYEKPVIEIVAGESPPIGADVRRPGSPVIPGYNHLDVLTAAPIQNDGQPERTVTELLGFVY